jgi:hypothetical protein
MTGRLVASWTIGVDNRCTGDNRADPEWAEIERILEEIRARSGSLTIDLVDGPQTGAQSFQVLSDQGRFLLTLGEDDGVDYRVRSFTNPNASDVKVTVLGDMWSNKSLCTDFEVVRKAVKDFLNTGDVSHELLR